MTGFIPCPNDAFGGAPTNTTFPTGGIVSAATNVKTWPTSLAMWPTTYRQTVFEPQLGQAGNLTRK